MADISKYSVIDPRIVQEKPKYAVEKGAVSITNQTFSAIANSASQQTFQVQVPSENVFVDRAIDWVNTAYALVSLSYASAPAAGTALLTPGVDCSLAPFPTTQSISTMQATINDQSLSINMADVLPQVLRLADLEKTRKQRTCPTMLDRYYDVQSASTYPNSPVSSYGSAYSNDEVPCGAWRDLTINPTSASSQASGYVLDQFGVPRAASTVAGPSAVTGVSSGSVYQVVSLGTTTLTQWSSLGAPYVVGGVFTAGAAGSTVSGNGTVSLLTNSATSFTVSLQWSTAEKLVLPPFIFADEDELSTGLFGVQNMQFTMNFNQPGRSLRIAQGSFSVPPVVTWDSTQSAGTPFKRAVIQVQFLTPSLDVPLPAKSIVRWMEFPRYISPIASVTYGTAALPQTTVVQSQTITLPMIPDLLVMFVKPQTYSSRGQLDPTQCDWSLPITNISLSFDNFSGLLANHSQYELYKMSVNNGLEMDWDEWAGSAWASGSKTALVGGPLVLRPGRDFALSVGQAPGLVGNFTLQFNLTLQNSTGYGYASDSGEQYGSGVSIYTITANSGFFETIKGASRILRGVVTEQDILGAPVVEPEQSMDRMVGEGKHQRHMGHGKHHKMSKYVRS